MAEKLEVTIMGVYRGSKGNLMFTDPVYHSDYFPCAVCSMEHTPDHSFFRNMYMSDLIKFYLDSGKYSLSGIALNKDRCVLRSVEPDKIPHIVIYTGCDMGAVPDFIMRDVFHRYI